MRQLPVLLRDGFEIDMGGQILLARIGQHGGEGVPANRLERIADGAVGMAVIDEERGPARASELGRNGPDRGWRAPEIARQCRHRGRTPKRRH